MSATTVDDPQCLTMAVPDPDPPTTRMHDGIVAAVGPAAGLLDTSVPVR